MAQPSKELAVRDPKHPLNLAPAQMAALSGSQSTAFQRVMITKVVETIAVPQQASNEANQINIAAALAMLEGIAPRNELEGMLAAQMVATNNAAIECLRRANLSGQSSQVRDMELKHAAKMLDMSLKQLAVLDKHRGKGRQKITVEHVTVEAGGQAIVGEVHAAKGAATDRGEGKPAALPDDTSAEIACKVPPPRVRVRARKRERS